jgi:DNA adenine methylase
MRSTDDFIGSSDNSNQSRDGGGRQRRSSSQALAKHQVETTFKVMNAVRQIVFPKFGPNTCILATRLAVAALKRYSIQSIPLPVMCLINNPSWTPLAQELGRDPSQREKSMATSRFRKLLAGRLLSCRETAQPLNVSPDSIRRLVRAGHLEAIRIGKRSIRVLGDSIDRHIDTHGEASCLFCQGIQTADPGFDGGGQMVSIQHGPIEVTPYKSHRPRKRRNWGANCRSLDDPWFEWTSSAERQTVDLEFFRFPGSKTKLRSEIIKRLPSLNGREYREPFFGSGAIGLTLLADKADMTSIWINDKDIGVASFWTGVIRYPEDLIDRVHTFTPNVKAFVEIRDELLGIKAMPKQKSRIVDIAFKKLAIHQLSYSGLGTMSGGPLGGVGQTGKYKIDSRWSPQVICEKIRRFHNQFKAISVRYGGCTDLDFSALITDTNCDCVLYLDPPYFGKGKECYQHSFTLNDHERLAGLLRQTNHAWVLSYDDSTEIRQMYSWAAIDTIEATYSIAHPKNTKTGRKTNANKTELLIYP